LNLNRPTAGRTSIGANRRPSLARTAASPGLRPSWNRPNRNSVNSNRALAGPDRDSANPRRARRKRPNRYPAEPIRASRSRPDPAPSQINRGKTKSRLHRTRILEQRKIHPSQIDVRLGSASPRTERRSTRFVNSKTRNGRMRNYRSESFRNSTARDSG